jgi:hypothetical protein
MSDSKLKTESLKKAKSSPEPTPRAGLELGGQAVADAARAREADAPSGSEQRQRRRRKRVRGVGYDAQGHQRPRFLLSFPKDPELAELVRAFEAGDYARVRREAPALAERATEARVRAAARELRRRIDPDPALRYILIAALALLAVLVYWAYGHSGH